jgi:hypothetical protein
MELVPPTRIERATRGLGIIPNPTSDNLNPQETTTQDALETGSDGASLSCPGSNVVADVEKQDGSVGYSNGRTSSVSW